ncbi:MAG TPA: hypothetical protein VLK59_13525 [Solirubrobacteraceae bacterium]|nr:hypothetical protein [Solirubrobacteraceae bacterium]
MVGKFDDTLVFKPGSNELNVAGTLSDCAPADAGKEVEITVTRLEQNGDSVHCSKKFTVPAPPAVLTWTMKVSADFTTGTAEGDATAKIKGGPSFSWTAPANPNPEPPPPVVAPINIVRN